jgi:hypothetical protein
MNNAFTVMNGSPHIIKRADVNLGLVVVGKEGRLALINSA